MTFASSRRSRDRMRRPGAPRSFWAGTRRLTALAWFTASSVAGSCAWAQQDTARKATAVRARNAATDNADPHTAEPERPTVATPASTVARGWVEIEFGGQRSEAGGVTSASTPTVLKIGLASRVQLSVFGNWSDLTGRGAHAAGFADAAVGVKWRIADRAPVVGDFAVLPTITLPTGARGIGSGTTALGILLISSHEIGPLALDLNAGYTHRSGSGSRAPRASTLWTVSLASALVGPLGWVGELSGLPGTGGPSGSAPIVACLFGPTVTARNWIVFDAGISPTLRGAQPSYVYAGVTWNIGRL
jgi:hypothetical protein